MAGTKLLPCPFCGGEARTASKDYGDTHYWRVFCDTPSCAMCMTSVFNSEASAIAAWNKRAETVTVVTGITTVTDTPQITYVPERTCRIVKTSSDSDYVDDWRYRCSECGCNIPVNERDPKTGDVIDAANYCPNCGAKVVSE